MPDGLKALMKRELNKAINKEYSISMGEDRRALFNKAFFDVMDLLEIDELEFTGKITRRKIETENGEDKYKYKVKRRILQSNLGRDEVSVSVVK